MYFSSAFVTLGFFFIDISPLVVSSTVLFIPHILEGLRGRPELKCDGTRRRTGWGSEGETGECSG